MTRNTCLCTSHVFGACLRGGDCHGMAQLNCEPSFYELLVTTQWCGKATICNLVGQKPHTEPGLVVDTRYHEALTERKHEFPPWLNEDGPFSHDRHVFLLVATPGSSYHESHYARQTTEHSLRVCASAWFRLFSLKDTFSWKLLSLQSGWNPPYCDPYSRPYSPREIDSTAHRGSSHSQSRVSNRSTCVRC